MTPLPDGMEKLLPAKVVEKAYADLASQPAKEVSKIAVDLVTTVSGPFHRYAINIGRSSRS